MPIAVMRPAIHAHCLRDIILEVIGFLIKGSPIEKVFWFAIENWKGSTGLPRYWGETQPHGAISPPSYVFDLGRVAARHGILLYLQLHLYGLRSASRHNLKEAPLVTPIFQLW
jgi:hypothetical protein